MFYQNYLAMSNTTDVTGGKPIAVWSQSISGVNAINLLVAFYDIILLGNLCWNAQKEPVSIKTAGR
jgi:hypothetical protein